MTDPRQAGPPGPRPDRLQRWFAAQIRAAEQDVERGLVTISGTPRARLGSRGIAGAAVAAAGVVVLLAVALTSSFLGGAVGPSPSSGTTQPTASSRVVVGPDGIPVSIDGAPVLNASAALARALASIDPTSFLVGGWLSDAKAACPTALTPQSPLLDTGLCGGQPALLDSPPVDARGQPAVDWNGRIVWPVFLDGSSPPEPRPSGDLTQPQAFDLAVVLRVHTHDASASTCAADVRPQCDLAVVVDTVLWQATVTPAPVPSPAGPLYPDGIPMTLGGESVLRPTQAAARAAASTDASSFLVGGWITTWFPYTGCPRPSGSEADQVLAGGLCAAYLTEAPVTDETGPLQLHFRAPVTGWYGTGPVILRVHTHDPLATSCAAANQDACARAVVVDSLLWDGPALGPDGLPSWIDGHATTSVPEAQAMLAHSTGGTELFVRGWYSGFGVPCPLIPATVPPTPGSSLLPDDCQPSILGAGPIPNGQDHATASDLDLTLGPGADAPPTGAVVLEIHGHDPAAAACVPSIRAACEAAVIVDRVVWTASTGLVAPAPTATPGSVDIPSAIDGQPVLRGQAFVDRVAHATDETSFLVGGWMPTTPEVYFCALIPAPSPGASFDPAAEALCGGLWFLDAPGDPQGVLRGSPPWVAVRINVVTTVPAWGAPFVMRVHVHQRSVIEDALVWVGLSPSR